MSTFKEMPSIKKEMEKLDAIEKTEGEKAQEKIWNEKVERVGKRLDRIGGEMDPGIIETVAALNLHGIPTSGSCEGHLDHGIPSPWIDVVAEQEPKEHYNDQDKIYEKVARKHGIAVAVMRDGKHQEAWREACIACDASGETEAYKLWEQKNMELRKKVEELLAEYKGQQLERSPSAASIKQYGGFFRVFTGGKDYDLREKAIKELPRAEQEALALRLREHQAEMKRFMEYLKQKYFSAISGSSNRF